MFKATAVDQAFPPPPPASEFPPNQVNVQTPVHNMLGVVSWNSLRECTKSGGPLPKFKTPTVRMPVSQLWQFAFGGQGKTNP